MKPIDRIGASVTVSKEQLLKGYPESLLVERLRESLTTELVENCCTAEDSLYSTTYRIDLIVCTPDEFIHQVQLAKERDRVGYPLHV